METTVFEVVNVNDDDEQPLVIQKWQYKTVIFDKKHYYRVNGR